MKATVCENIWHYILQHSQKQMPLHVQQFVCLFFIWAVTLKVHLTFSESWQWKMCDSLTTTASFCTLTASLIIEFWILNQFSYSLSSCMSIQFCHTLENGVKRVHTNVSHCSFLSTDTVRSQNFLWFLLTACFPADGVMTSLKLNKDRKRQTYKLCSI